MPSDTMTLSTQITAQLRFGARRGLDRGDMLAAGGLPADYMPGVEDRIPHHQTMALWEYILRQLRDPGAPIHFAESSAPGDYAALGFAVMASRTVREGMVRSVRYLRAVVQLGHFQLLETPSLVVVDWTRDLPLTLGVRSGNEAIIAQFVQFCRMASGMEVIPRMVTFRHAAPRSIAVHEAFFGCRVIFGADRNSLHFDPTFLDAPLPGADDALVEFLDRYLKKRAADPGAPRSLKDRVRAALLSGLTDGVPTSEQVARGLGMSDRSLRRHLRREGASYRELVQSVRLQFAQALLHDSNSSIAEVAFLAGYSDAGAFSRAFRRDMGRSPREFRERASATA